MRWTEPDYCLEQCLESLLHDWRTPKEKQEFIARQEELKGKRFADKLRARYKAEWEDRKK